MSSFINKHSKIYITLYMETFNYWVMFLFMRVLYIVHLSWTFMFPGFEYYKQSCCNIWLKVIVYTYVCFLLAYSGPCSRTMHILRRNTNSSPESLGNFCSECQYKSYSSLSSKPMLELVVFKLAFPLSSQS